MKTSILVGSRLDPQCQTLAAFADVVCWWEEWNQCWSISTRDGHISFHLKPNHSLSADTTHLYLRYAGCPHEAEDQYVALAALHPEMIGVARPGAAPLNKLTPLKLFGTLAPRTLVTNDPSRIKTDPKTAVVKNISPLRSIATTYDHLLKFQSSAKKTSRLAVPTLFQEKIKGREYKHHHYAQSYSQWSLTTEVLKPPHAVDYRYDHRDFLTRSETAPPKSITNLGVVLTKNPSTPLIDLDYFVGENGSVKVLEWNDSPESVSFEERLRLRQNWSFSRILLAPLQTVLISPQNDRVVQVLAENHPLETQVGSPLVSLSCEGFTKEWHFGLQEGSLIFYCGPKPLIPTGIYIRPVNVPETLAQDYDGLFRAVELWSGPTFGSMSYGFYNSSKMFQTQSSLGVARKRSGACNYIRFPKAYFIKGQTPESEKLLHQKSSLIVKSCSGARSIVVDQDHFNRWDFNNLHSIPTLFQNTILGPDIRVHGLRDQLFAVRVASKDSIDYRYADERGGFEAWSVPTTVRKFVEDLGRLEGNPLIGVDLIENDGYFYCLEANPTPGWTWYYNRSTCKVNHLAQGILNILTGA